MGAGLETSLGAFEGALGAGFEGSLGAGFEGSLGAGFEGSLGAGLAGSLGAGLAGSLGAGLAGSLRVSCAGDFLSESYPLRVGEGGEFCGGAFFSKIASSESILPWPDAAPGRLGGGE